MARKNRVSVYDGIYHVTSRIANRAMLLANSTGTATVPPELPPEL